MLPAICAVLLQAAAASPPGAPAVTAVRLVRAPAVDGRLDDPDWALATPVTALLQIDPDEGTAASESTEVRVLYDADAIYVGARLFDSESRR
ncbi:MAG TPA: hypothetical protein VGQ29_13915, partial [Gemmatimonadales bacterium]|nr:hypothetical protein [Gemmatimonadales bacterium]